MMNAGLYVDLGLTGLPNVVGIDTVRIVIPLLKVPLIFKSRPHAPQLSQGRAYGDDEGPSLYGGPMASVKQIQVTFDCAEPERVARPCCRGDIAARPAFLIEPHDSARLPW
jgi:hypothetical protein